MYPRRSASASGLSASRKSVKQRSSASGGRAERSISPRRVVLGAAGGGEHGGGGGGEGPRPRMVAGHQRVRLHVEEEPGGRALDPEGRVPGRGERVVGGVHLHGVEGGGIVAEALFRRHGAGGIELSLF